ncbi:MAG: hypothetical protein IT279_10135 [Ignavibacteriaceae bacterium]|nr:hypothetical protein [Ignavibacteriaceae bacterium]
MTDESKDIFLPLLRMDIVLMPHNSIVLEVNSEPVYSLMKDKIEEDGEFAVFFEDDEGMSEFGVTAYVEQYEYAAEDTLVCKITGKERIEAKTIIPSERIGNTFRSNANELSAEELRSLVMYDFVDGTLLSDVVEEPNPSVKKDIFTFIESSILKLNPDYNIESLRRWMSDAETEQLSYRLMNGFYTDNSPMLNQIRTELLSRNSENERLQIFKKLLEAPQE